MVGELAKRVQESLAEVLEEETNRRLSELNVVSEIREEREGAIRVRFTPLSAYSPTAVDLGRSIREAASRAEGVKEVTVECSGHMQDELVNQLVNGEKRRL